MVRRLISSLSLSLAILLALNGGLSTVKATPMNDDIFGAGGGLGDELKAIVDESKKKFGPPAPDVTWEVMDLARVQMRTRLLNTRAKSIRHGYQTRVPPPEHPDFEPFLEKKLNTMTPRDVERLAKQAEERRKAERVRRRENRKMSQRAGSSTE